MTAITSAKSTIHIEETQYKSAVSENTMTKIGAAINWVNENAGDILGMTMACYLTEAQFASQKGYDHTVSIESRKWAIMSGQNITGSDFEVLTGITTLPNMTTGSRFIRQAGDSATLGQQQSGQNISHDHVQRFISGPIGTAYEQISHASNYPQNGSFVDTADQSSNGVSLASTDRKKTISTALNGGSETRPNSLALNIFIKINN